MPGTRDRLWRSGFLAEAALEQLPATGLIDPLDHGSDKGVDGWGGGLQAE